MSRLSAISIALILSLTGHSLPAIALDQNEINEYIREQQAEECTRQGGIYRYPQCHLPEAPQPAPSDTDECDVSCKVILGLLGLAAARIAYCKANPDKC
jgi:hypothetical protein